MEERRGPKLWKRRVRKGREEVKTKFDALMLIKMTRLNLVGLVYMCQVRLSDV